MVAVCQPVIKLMIDWLTDWLKAYVYYNYKNEKITENDDEI